MADRVQKLIDLVAMLLDLFPDAAERFPALAPLIRVARFLRDNEEFIGRFVDLIGGAFASPPDVADAPTHDDWLAAAELLRGAR